MEARRRVALLCSHLLQSSSSLVRSSVFPSSLISSSNCGVADENEKEKEENCVFCKIVRGESPSFKIYEDDVCLCILDLNPLAPGSIKCLAKKMVGAGTENCWLYCLDYLYSSETAAYVDLVLLCPTKASKGQSHNPFHLIMHTLCGGTSSCGCKRRFPLYYSGKTWEHFHLTLFSCLDRHSLVIPKCHFSSLKDTPPSVVALMCSKVPLVSNAIMKATNCDSFNLLVNCGVAAGQVIFHTHLHIIPRRAQDHLWKSENSSRQPQSLDQEAAQLAFSIREKLSTLNENWEDSKAQGTSSS